MNLIWARAISSKCHIRDQLRRAPTGALTQYVYWFKQYFISLINIINGPGYVFIVRKFAKVARQDAFSLTSPC